MLQKPLHTHPLAVINLPTTLSGPRVSNSLDPTTSASSLGPSLQPQKLSELRGAVTPISAEMLRCPAHRNTHGGPTACRKFQGSSTEQWDQGPVARARRPMPAELLMLTVTPHSIGQAAREGGELPVSTRSQQVKTGPCQPFQPHFPLLVLNSLRPDAIVSWFLR